MWSDRTTIDRHTPRNQRTNHLTASRRIPKPADRRIPAVVRHSAPKPRIGDIRREQIIIASIDIIALRGLPELSLSAIEARTGMKRGQLTYYYRTKEAILLAVFDRLLLMMYRQMEGREIDPTRTRGIPPVWDCVQHALQMILGPAGEYDPVFSSLQYTFLAQMAHRDDYRERLAAQYEEWRSTMAAHWLVSARTESTLARSVSPRTVASMFHAIVHGLKMQLTVDADAFDRSEMLRLCVGLLLPLFVTVGEHR